MPSEARSCAAGQLRRILSAQIEGQRIGGDLGLGLDGAHHRHVDCAGGGIELVRAEPRDDLRELGQLGWWAQRCAEMREQEVAQLRQLETTLDAAIGLLDVAFTRPCFGETVEKVGR